MINKDIEKQVLNFYDKNKTLTYKEIGKNFNLNSEQVRHIFRKNNLKTKELDIKYIGVKLNFRMFLAKNHFLRNLYRRFYFNHVKNVEDSKLENFIQNLFFK